MTSGKQSTHKFNEMLLEAIPHEIFKAKMSHYNYTVYTLIVTLTLYIVTTPPIPHIVTTPLPPTL